MKQIGSRFSLKSVYVTLLVAVVLTGGVIYYLRGSGYSSKSVQEADATLVSIGKIQLALAAYMHLHQSYPKTTHECEAFTTIAPELLSAGLIEVAVLTELTKGYPINISVSSDALHYVIQTEGSGMKQHSAIINHIDGTVLGCNCDDPKVCISDAK